MEHLFVPYAIALLAKEKGFSEPCLRYFTPENERLLCLVRGNETVSNEQFKNDPVGYVAAPIHQQLIDWLRVKHKVTILLDHVDNTKRYHFNYILMDGRTPSREFNDEDLIDQATQTYSKENFTLTTKL